MAENDTTLTARALVKVNGMAGTKQTPDQVTAIVNNVLSNDGYIKGKRLTQAQFDALSAGDKSSVNMVYWIEG